MAALSSSPTHVLEPTWRWEMSTVRPRASLPPPAPPVHSLGQRLCRLARSPPTGYFSPLQDLGGVTPAHTNRHNFILQNPNLLQLTLLYFPNVILYHYEEHFDLLMLVSCSFPPFPPSGFSIHPFFFFHLKYSVFSLPYIWKAG